MEQKRKMELLEDLFELEQETLTSETSLSSLNWDSMAMLGLIAMFRSELDKKLEPAEIRKFKTISDILAAMDV